MATARTSIAPVPIILEVGTKRVFASALDWPGWARSGRDEEHSVAALAAYADRYRPIARAANQPIPPRVAFEVVDRLSGDATTDFGAPGMASPLESATLSAAEAGRLASLLEAAWGALDAAIASAPAVLRKGPRGGGRDGDRVLAHVLGAEAAYARKIGLRLREPPIADLVARATFATSLLTAVRSGNAADGASWSLRYAARRIGWHALDHAWEIEDRSVG